MSIRQPMLASNEMVTREMLGQMKVWPKIASIKKDGFRCMSLARGGVVRPMSRYMKPIPNFQIQDEFEYFPAMLDGELVVKGGNFQDCQSRFTTKITFPFKYQYLVFDHLGYLDMPYHKRLQVLQRTIDRYCQGHPIKIMPFREVEDEDEAWEFYCDAIEAKEEGIILRDPMATYKQGRATFNSEAMFKLKAWIDGEAVILGVEEAYENTNAKQLDERGYAKRSSKKDGRVPKGTLGALYVRDVDTRIEFSIGSGWTAEEAAQMWKARHHLPGEIVAYKCQPYGQKEKPRQPIWKGLRPEREGDPRYSKADFI